MPNQINIKDTAETPENESLPYRLGYLKTVMSKRAGRRMTASDVVRELVADAYKRELARLDRKARAKTEQAK